LSDWWAGAPPSRNALQRFRGRPTLAAAGMAQPSRFFRMLEDAGLTITPLPLPDHYDFSALPWPPGTLEVLVTEKDAVKLRPDRVGSTQVWVVPLDFRFDAAFERELLGMLPPPSTRTPHGHPTA
jgi:tetraacyldisaccharide 4'-kinase